MFFSVYDNIFDVGKHHRPHRSMSWIRKCYRCILFCKIKEDVNISTITGETIRFPQFVYSWFERSTSINSMITTSNGINNRGTVLTRSLITSDEDRWAFYYSTRALSRDQDPEGKIS